MSITFKLRVKAKACLKKILYRKSTMIAPTLIGLMGMLRASIIANPHLAATTGLLVASEIMPFFPQLKGNGLVHSVTDFVSTHKKQIAELEQLSQVDIDCDGTIGESKSESADASKEDDSKTAVSNMVVYSGFLHGLRFKVTVEVS